MYDPTTPAGQVRLLINDVDDANPVFTDPEIATFLVLEDGDVRYAAAQALDTIAANEVLVQKVQKTMDLQTDGARVADALMRRAESLRHQADQADLIGEPFAVAEFADPVFASREVRRRQAMRGSW